MSNNFMGVGGNSALSKNSTDGILNLLQLSLLGNNAGVNNAAPTQNITNLNSSIVPNTNNLMAAKTNFYSQSVGASMSGIGVSSIASGILSSQPIMSQPVSIKTTDISISFIFLFFQLKPSNLITIHIGF